MIEQLPALALLFAVIAGLNLIPAFAPPTWMALALVGFHFPDANPVLLTLLGATAATLGRLTLAKLSKQIVRNKLLSAAQRANIDVIKARLEQRPVFTLSVFLFYAFSPLPSNFLFIAYGISGLPILRVAVPFFIGRSVSYAVFIVGGGAAGRHFNAGAPESIVYASGWFIATQCIVLAALYILARIDWTSLFDRHSLRWMRK